MKVAELIEHLSQFPPDLPVSVEGYETGWIGMHSLRGAGICRSRESESWDGEFGAVSEFKQTGLPAVLIVGRRGHIKMNTTIDAATQGAVREFLERLGGRYVIVVVYLYGSRARQTHSEESDADLAIILKNHQEPMFDTRSTMSEIAFDVLLDTGILIHPFPLLEDDWLHADQFTNPDLIHNIRRDAVAIASTEK